MSLAGRWAAFEAKFDVADDGCWIWKASKFGAGYGKFRYEGCQKAAHRYSYRVKVGEIPAGHEIDHLCRNKSCVNPAHLEPVTHSTNMRRARGTDDACPRGHKRADHSFVRTDGHLACRVCARAVQRARYMKKKSSDGLVPSAGK